MPFANVASALQPVIASLYARKIQVTHHEEFDIYKETLRLYLLAIKASGYTASIKGEKYRIQCFAILAYKKFVYLTPQSFETVIDETFTLIKRDMYWNHRRIISDDARDFFKSFLLDTHCTADIGAQGIYLALESSRKIGVSIPMPQLVALVYRWYGHVKSLGIF